LCQQAYHKVGGMAGSPSEVDLLNAAAAFDQVLVEVKDASIEEEIEKLLIIFSETEKLLSLKEIRGLIGEPEYTCGLRLLIATNFVSYVEEGVIDYFEECIYSMSELNKEAARIRGRLSPSRLAWQLACVRASTARCGLPVVGVRQEAEAQTPLYSLQRRDIKTLHFADADQYRLAKEFIEAVSCTLALSEYGGCSFIVKYDDVARNITAEDDPAIMPGVGIALFLANMDAVQQQWERRVRETFPPELWSPSP
jgi:hypothetical protein